jgi:hypothetical protein
MNSDRYPAPKNAKPLFIFDLDGTLAEIDHRRAQLDTDLSLAGAGGNLEPAWRRFYAACVDDTIIEPVARIYRTLAKAGNDVWIWTGRSDEVIRDTRDWLLTAGMFPDQLRMRKAGDHRADDVLKAEWLGSLAALDTQRLVCVFEDRRRVVDMWRGAGVQCLQVAPGAF